MSEQVTTAAMTGTNSCTKRKFGPEWVRKRVSQACDQCRKKKLKCDGLRPTCSTCESIQKQCFYGDTVKKRGLPEGYVRGLEKLLGLLFSNPNSIGSVTTMFDRALKDEAARSDLIQQWSSDGAESTENLHEVWRTSKLCTSFERLLPLLDSGDKGQEVKRLRLEPHLVHSKIGVDAPARSSLQIPVCEVAEDLFKIYFTYTHCWLPIIGKDEMLAAYYRALELSASSLGMGEYAALWAVLAYAECQRSSPRDSRGMGYVQQSLEAESYYNKARSLIPSEDSDLHIGHVQALLVLSLVKLAMGQFRASWLLVGQAINIAIDIGINNTSSIGFSSSVGRSKNVFLGCFYLDTIIAAYLGRAPRLTREDALGIGFLDENGLEEWGHLELVDRKDGDRPGSSRILSIFNHLVQLVCVLNDLAHGQATENLQGKWLQDTPTMLNNWKNSLPDYCSLKIESGSVPQTVSISPHQLNLNITFLICKVVYERRSNTNTGELTEEVDALHQLLGAYNSRFAYGLTVFPPALYLISSVGRDTVGSSIHRAARRSPQVRSSGVNVAPTGVDSFQDGTSGTVAKRNPNYATFRKSPDSGMGPKPIEDGMLTTRSARNGFSSSINSLTTHSGEDAIMAGSLDWLRESGLQSVDTRTSFSPGTWDLQSEPLSPVATVASSSDCMSARGNIESKSARLAKYLDNYSGHRTPFHISQSHQSSEMRQTGQEKGDAVENLPTTFSALNPSSSGVGGLTPDSVLQTMTTADDHFFELSNLDHL